LTIRAKRPLPCACGSYHTLDSIGSRVKETNSEIRTAAETITPNWKKNRPMMPPMKATGRKTATMQKVVASTASPISSVPSIAAWRCVLPNPMWRMMFSRTTIASSIRMPTARLSAIRVSTFRVKPNAASTMKAPSTEIGSARPVITVLRQECRNRKTMAMVSRPPSTMVSWTLFTEFWMPRELSRTMSSSTSGGRDLRSSAMAWRTPRATSIVLEPCVLTTSIASARAPFSSATLSSSCCPSTTVATWRR
jgi:hypothetical protein